MTTSQVQNNNASGIPKLRFRGFEGSWKHVRLSFLLKESKERNEDLKFGKDKVLSVSGKYGVVNQIEHLGRSYAGESVHNYHVVQNGDIVYTKSPLKDTPYGIIKLNKGDAGIVSTLYAVYKPIEEHCYGEFLDHYFSLDANTNRYLRPLVKIGAKNDMKISNTYVLHDKIYAPLVDEQKKISDFFNSINSSLQKLQKEVALLREYKIGFIQRVFSQKVRFKDSNNKDFPEWKEKSLKEILKERKTFSTKGNGYPHISLTTKGVVPKSERYDRDFLVGNDEVKGYKITHLNDLCYNPANLKFGVISLNRLGDGIFSPIYVTFEIIGQNIDFISYYLTRTEFINKARRYEQGTVYERMSVSPSDFLKVKVKIPSLPEQEKIANLLKSLDRLIETKEKQLEQAEQWKKGLMQKLFL